jgi:hypothetical protein
MIALLDAAPNADIGDGSSRRRTLALRSTGAGTRLISRSRTFSTRAKNDGRSVSCSE